MKSKHLQELAKARSYAAMMEQAYTIIASCNAYYIKALFEVVETCDDMDDVLAMYIKDELDTILSDQKINRIKEGIQKLYEAFEADEAFDFNEK